MNPSQPLRLVHRTRDEVRAAIDALPPDVRREVSADYLALLEASKPQDPWVHGFRLCVGDEDVGMGGFKGPPTDGVVEIAYAINPDSQGKGYATEAARAMTEFAFASGAVRLVCAHTLPDGAASQRVLAKAGFRHVGEAADPDDGLVWRFEKSPG